MSERPPIPLWRRLLVAGAWFALALVVVSGSVYLVNRGRLVSELERVTRELDESDPGWRWDGLLAARPEIDDNENSAVRIRRILAVLPRGWPDYKKQEKLNDVPPNVVLDPERRALFDELMTPAPLPDLRAQARELVRFPRGRIEIVLAENPYATMLEEHQRLRAVANLLMLDAWHLSHDGKHGEAMRSARACLMASRALETDPMLIGQLIRCAIANVSLNIAERAMALGDVPDDELRAFQEALAHEASGTRLTVALRGERASAHQATGAIAAGRLSIRAVDDGPPPTPGWWSLQWLTEVAGRETARREHAAVLRLMTAAVETSRLPAKDQFAAEADFETAAKASGPFTKRVVPGIAKVNQAGRRTQASAAAMRALIAAERYRQKHGKWPAKLADAIDPVPTDPIDGNPVRYARWAEGVVVYSIGNDRKDDGGDVEKSLHDFGHRLWDADKRRAAGR